MSKFKEGDTVVVLRNTTDSNDVQIGKTFVIDGIDEDGAMWEDGADWAYYEHELGLPTKLHKALR